MDGTLLNHDDYRYDDALEMLGILKERQIPLIFTTSKTKQECLQLQEKIGISDPFIVENGACIFGSSKGDIQLGISFTQIREFIDEVKGHFGVRSFHDMQISEVMGQTGFSKEQATLAKERDFSEPFLLEDESQLQGLKEAAKDVGMKILKGGRFYHCVGENQDKGKAVQRLLETYHDSYAIGLGDNYNDIDMLRVVDQPILIPHHEGAYIDVEISNLLKAPFQGAKGWNHTLKEVLCDV